MYGLSSFFIGEQRVAAELGPMMRAAPDEDMRIFLCTQIADEARHVAFFDRFYSEVGVLEADNLQDRLAETAQHLNPEFGVLFDEMLQAPRRPAGARARGPRDAGRGGDDLPHGHRGHARPHRPALHHRLQRARGHAARASSRASRNVARDEHRHVAFGARFLRDMAQRDPRYTEAIQRTLVEVAPVADGVLRRKWMRRATTTSALFGVVGRRDARVRDEGARAAA